MNEPSFQDQHSLPQPYGIDHEDFKTFLHLHPWDKNKAEVYGFPTIEIFVDDPAGILIDAPGDFFGTVPTVQDAIESVVPILADHLDIHPNDLEEFGESLDAFLSAMREPFVRSVPLDIEAVRRIAKEEAALSA